MIINHNIAALNTYRQLSANNVLANKSLEKLSSGLRIVRAGDDAAGLAISEKMRAQIRGLNMAAKNAQDGISLIQTAEGALNETHAILQRMRELAVQSASDTNIASDRAEIQKEVDQLAQELSRIGNTTEFNTQKLLNGTFKGIFHIGANENQNISLDIADMRSAALGVLGDVYYQDTGTVAKATTGSLIQDGTYTVSYDNVSGKYLLKTASGTVVAESNDGTSYTGKVSGDSITFNDPVTSGQVVISGTSATGMAKVDNSGLDAGVYTYDGTNKVLKNALGEIVATEDSTTAGKFLALDGTTVLFTISGTLANGDTITVGGIDVSSQTAANTAIVAIQKAIDLVSAERSKLGAYQNRLEHTINNLGTASENLSAAESRIRDIDMAKEMMEYTKLSILQQAATAMLSQANQQPQMVLQLLR
ncbi:flagellin [Desulfofundulus salinus]|uniref:Flagellin n=1 Tax=Desulfofundulus salinus TaxID=2419843 RepID=A0A494X1W2_9FIRM|nr:flagellin [Desulfofundulus salinum]RKO66890.1 flagellin [Desulfofundulus salinum]